MSDSYAAAGTRKLVRIIAIGAVIGLGIFTWEKAQQRSADEARHAKSTVIPRKAANEFPAWIDSWTLKIFNANGDFVTVSDPVAGSFSVPKSAPYSVACDSGNVTVTAVEHRVIVYAPGLYDSPDAGVHPASPAADKLVALACEQTRQRLEEVFSP